MILHNAVPPGAPPDERDVLDQVAAVQAALEGSGHESLAVPVGLDFERLRQEIDAARPDCVFNLVESVAGEDRGLLVVPALLESFGVPYTGASLQGALMTTNKVVAKRLLRDAALPTPAWYAPGDPDEAADALAGDQAILKPLWDHGSRDLDEVDVLHVESGAALRRRIEAAESERFAERYVEGREFNLAVLARPGKDPEVLPVAEMCFVGWEPGRPRVIGYRAKWVTDSAEYANTVRRFEFEPHDRPLLRELERLARQCWRAFGLRGYARVDFRVDREGAPWILEVNVNPCLTPDAGFAAALDRAKVGYNAAIERILADAVRPKSAVTRP